MARFTWWYLGLLLFLASFSCVNARWGQGGRAGVDKRKASERDYELLEQIKDEGQDMTEDEMLQRLRELKSEHHANSRRAKEHRQNSRDPNDPWRNGTYVRYMAKGCGVVLVVAAIYAFKDGIETDSAKLRKKQGVGKQN
eukprot:CAMPEP_0206372112 /NCGR_PEP_ID=MMETSP0294-20121207/6905_1 /ASSEMBLY_ACC=CAM_ASM_000327 /TAXON_ID=39354 /ORGANISM="Heterosigma akashiwo, Strain CCMP2393" /LENGTH=139 /DNA_ID=CAMNT_0053819409 /DNA_START=75 /DNA_END=494 /DNA_ORIENTATION=+